MGGFLGWGSLDRFFEFIFGGSRVWVVTRVRTGNVKGEIRGSLHCATDDETVCCFGRDDDSLGWEEEKGTRVAQEADLLWVAVNSTINQTPWHQAPSGHPHIAR